MNWNLVKQIEDLYISGLSENEIAIKTGESIGIVEAVVYNLNATLNEQLTYAAYSYSNYE
jgi:hypothetical protein